MNVRPSRTSPGPKTGRGTATFYRRRRKRSTIAPMRAPVEPPPAPGPRGAPPGAGGRPPRPRGAPPPPRNRFTSCFSMLIGYPGPRPVKLATIRRGRGSRGFRPPMEEDRHSRLGEKPPLLTVSLLLSVAQMSTAAFEAPVDHALVVKRASPPVSSWSSSRGSFFTSISAGSGPCPPRQGTPCASALTTASLTAVVIWARPSSFQQAPGAAALGDLDLMPDAQR